MSGSIGMAPNGAPASATASAMDAAAERSSSSPRREAPGAGRHAEPRYRRPVFRMVERFFQLLDTDKDGRVSHKEARSSFLISFNATHLNAQRDGLNVSETVDKEVEELFKRAQNTKYITLEQMLEIYRKLLKDNYEEEVLTIDLQRAISALENSRKSLEVKFEGFFIKVRQLFGLLNAKGDGHLTRAEASKGLRVVCKAMYAQPASGASGGSSIREPPSIAGFVQKQVDWLFSHAKVSLDVPPASSLASGSSSAGGMRGMEVFRRSAGPINPLRRFDQPSSFINIEGFVECYKQLLHDKYDYEVLEIDLRRAVLALEAMERSQGALDDETKFQEDSPSTAARASDKKGSILDLHRRPDHTEN